jgi:hypothetical protein
MCRDAARRVRDDARFSITWNRRLVAFWASLSCTMVLAIDLFRGCLGKEPRIKLERSSTMRTEVLAGGNIDVGCISRVSSRGREWV